jgi:hypothetical protein
VIDDNGNEIEFEEDDKFVLTPKGFWCAVLLEYGISFEKTDEMWKRLEGWAMQMLKAEDEDAAFAAIVLDGDGGVIVGAGKHDESNNY